MMNEFDEALKVITEKVIDPFGSVVKDARLYLRVIDGIIDICAVNDEPDTVEVLALKKKIVKHIVESMGINKKH